MRRAPIGAAHIAVGAAIAAAIGLAGCGGGGEGPARSVAELQDPQTCNECHPKHYAQWSGSMHAYASDDPVFVAMNLRGQRDTGGALGTFCVKCHAPMAVELGLTDRRRASIPRSCRPPPRGITCYFCHDIKSVQDTHNNGLVLAGDQTMRGGLTGPVSLAGASLGVRQADGLDGEQVRDLRLVPRRGRPRAAWSSSARTRSGRPRSSPSRTRSTT